MRHTTAPVPAPASGCNAEGNRYLLGPAELEGTAEEAEALPDAGAAGQWVVSVVLSGEAADRLIEVSSRYAGTQQRVAVVVEGVVVLAPVFAGPIEGGELQIAGPDVTEDAARALAAALD